MAARYPVNIQQQQETNRLGGGGAQQAAPAFFYSPQPLYGGYPTQLTPQQLFALQQQQQQHIFLQQHNTAAAQQSYHHQQQQFALTQQQQQAAATALLQRAGNRAVAGHPQMATPPHQQVRPGVVLHPQHRMLAGAAVGIPSQPGKPLVQVLPPPPPQQQQQGMLAGIGPSAIPGAPDLGPHKGKLEVEDEYGLQPLLRVIMQQPPMSTTPSLPHASEEVNSETGRTASQHVHDQANFLFLTRGFDLSLLGLQVSQHEQLHPTIATLPLDEHQYFVFPDFRIPDCYKRPKPKPLSMKSFLYFKEETLFYIFYSMPRDVLHLAAARALYEREWRYHKKDQQWFRPALRGADGAYVAYHSPEARAAVREEVVVENYRGQHGVRALVGTYEVFEPALWRVSRTAPEYVILMSDVEDHTVLQAAMEEAARQQQRAAATTPTATTTTTTTTTTTAAATSDAGTANKS